MESQINWYLTSMGDSGTINPIPVTEDVVVGVHRRNDNSDDIYARVEGQLFDLGICDGSVSRMRDEGAPIRFSRDDEAVCVHNIDNAGSLKIVSPGPHREQKLKSGEQKCIDRDCTVEIGYTAKLFLTRELNRGADVTEQKETIEAGGMSVTAYVPIHCSKLQMVGEYKTRPDIQSCAENLLDVLDDHPRDVTGYQKHRDELADLIEELEPAPTEGSEPIKDDRIDRLVKITEKIEHVYRRKP